jgi:signal transduction histidine kinase
MRGMRERATLIGGRLEVVNPPGEPGCEVRLEVPR